MQGIRLEPARGLLENFTHAELACIVRHSRLDIALPRSRSKLADSITKHLSLDDLLDEIRSLFRAPHSRSRTKAAGRLDTMTPLHGSATVQAGGGADSHPRQPQLGLVLLGRSSDCIALRIRSVPLFLENRWPVLVYDKGPVPRARLYAAFIRPRLIHPSAEAPPPRTRPFILDEGNYQLRNSRLRLELVHAGPISCQVTFLRERPPSGRPEYLFEPIV